MKSRKSPPSHSVDISEEAGVRYLHFGSDWVQGAMRVARPWSLELDYTKEMMAGLLMRDGDGRWPRSVLMIGLGAGSLAKFVYRYLPDSRATVVEINPQVVFVAQQYFKVPDDPVRLSIEIADGAEYILAGNRRYDYILVDGFDADARCGALDTLPFYQACRTQLSEQGLLAVNLLGRNRGFAASVARLREAFDGRFAVLPSCDSGNAIAFACAGEAVDVALDTLRARAVTLKADTRLDLLPTLTRLQLGHPLPEGRLKI